MTNLILLNSGYFLVFLALAIREILWLRITITFGQSTLFTYSMLNGNYNIAFWNSVFVIVNIIQIIIIYRERQQLEIPEEVQDIYESIFHSNTHRQFLYFWDQGKIGFVKKKKIINAGDIQKDLMLVLNGTAEVKRGSTIIAKLERGQFIAEISYITGKSASADVVVDKKLSYMVWNRQILDNLRKTKPAIMEKLDRILTLDMADKLTK
ncbi:MAG: cyclic nucleotide-binding domain-containing protein [Candidatus Marinimicrobia bacterium]|nr:cyclic nucleotide-binding domain-containing protein [Candidatus Neomarinimicrobiota bacterium]